MFESTTCIRSQVKNESVVVIRNLAHQRHFCLDNLLHVAPHAVGIVIAFSIDHDAMRNAFNVEYESLEVIGFERGIVENVEVFGAESVLLTEHRWKSRGDFPNVRREHANSRGTLQETIEIHQEVGVVPKRVFRIQLACSN